jgi:hypothetical protein
MKEANFEQTVWTLRDQKFKAFCMTDKTTNWNQADKPA